jgi:hypothetical protein
MPRALQPGDRVSGFRVEKRLSQGAFAYAYQAVRESDGRPIFLKQYVDPSPEPPPPPERFWYPDYVRYQEELRRRIQAGPLSRS